MVKSSYLGVTAGATRFFIQRISASQSIGFKDHVFESSHGQSAATLVNYCISRSSELEEDAIEI